MRNNILIFIKNIRRQETGITMRLGSEALNKVIVNDDFPSILKRTILTRTIATRTITFQRNCARALCVCVLDVSFLSTSLSEDIPAKCRASRYDDKKYNCHAWWPLHRDIVSHGFLSREISILRTQDDDVLPIERKYPSDFSCNFIQTESTNYDLE